MSRWYLSEWNAHFVPGKAEIPPLSKAETSEAIQFLREHNYPKPEDCPEHNCPKYRPACALGICRIAVGMCGDFIEKEVTP